VSVFQLLFRSLRMNLFILSWGFRAGIQWTPLFVSELFILIYDAALLPPLSEDRWIQPDPLPWTLARWSDSNLAKRRRWSPKGNYPNSIRKALLFLTTGTFDRRPPLSCESVTFHAICSRLVHHDKRLDLGNFLIGEYLFEVRQILKGFPFPCFQDLGGFVLGQLRKEGQLLYGSLIEVQRSF